MVAGVISQEPPDCPVLRYCTGSGLPVEGSCNHLRSGVGLSLEGN